MLNKEAIIKELLSKASIAVNEIQSRILPEAVDRKAADKIGMDIGNLLAKSNGSATATRVIAKHILAKHENSAEAKLAIKNILDIKV